MIYTVMSLLIHTMVKSILFLKPTHTKYFVCFDINILAGGFYYCTVFYLSLSAPILMLVNDK